MNNENHQEENDVLERATAALRNVPVSEGPSAQKMDEILGMLPLPAQNAEELTHPGTSRYMSYRISSLAALVLVVIGVAGWFVFAEKEVAFADVLQQIRESRTISFRITSQGKGFPPIVVRQTMAEPGLVRMQMMIGGKNAGVTIFDHKKSAGISLIPSTKQAIKMTSSEDLHKQAACVVVFIDWLKSAQDLSTKDLGPRTISGKETFGFQVAREGQKWDVWVDQKNNLPVQMETTMEILGTSASIVMDEFTFDRKLNSNLFSLTPPPGYTVKQELEIREPSEQDAATLLRHLAELNGGEFPPDLDFPTIMKLGKKEPKQQKKTELKDALAHTRGLVFLNMNKAEYTGRGVKLGDAEKIVAWWLPQGKETYRAIYGDLTIRNGDGKQPASSK